MASKWRRRFCDCRRQKCRVKTTASLRLSKLRERAAKAAQEVMAVPDGRDIVWLTAARGAWASVKPDVWTWLSREYTPFLGLLGVVH